MRRMLGVSREIVNRSLDLDCVGVKVPMFSFSRLTGAGPMLGVETSSTGEVDCFGWDLHEALRHALLATGKKFLRKVVPLSPGPVVEKYWFADEAWLIANELQLPIYATSGTANMLAAIGIACTPVEKDFGIGVSGLEVIERGLVDMVINTARQYDQYGRPDGYLIRRQAIDLGVPLATDLPLASTVCKALRWHKPADLDVVAWIDFVGGSLPLAKERDLL